MKVILTRDFLALILSVAVVGLGIGTTLPLTALALTQAGYDTEVVGLLTAAQAVGGLAVVPLAGRIVARFGGRRAIVGAVLAAGVATALMQLTSNPWLWAGLRLLCGAALMLLFSTTEAWVNQLATDATRGRIVAIYSTIFTLFQLAGPVLVGQVADHTHWRFLLCGTIFMLALPMLSTVRLKSQAIGKPGNYDKHDKHGAHGHWRDVLPQMPALVIGTGFFALLDTIVLSLMPIFAMSHDVSSETALLFASALLLGDTMMQFPIGWLADRFGRERVHIGAAVIVVALLPTLPWIVSSPWLRWPLLFVLGAAAGAIYTLSLVACGQRFRGAALVSASSLIGASWSAASFGGPLAAGALMRGFGNDAMVCVPLAAALAFIAAAWWERRRTPIRVTG